MNRIKNPFEPLQHLVDLWGTVWKTAADRVSKKTLETVVILLTATVIVASVLTMQGIFFFALVYALIN
jgi:hypothetical protein